MKIKKLKIGDGLDGTRMIKRKAYMLYDDDVAGSGIGQIADVSFRPEPGYEPVELFYPQYAVGGQGEAQVVHLPSFPDRILGRARRATIIP